MDEGDPQQSRAVVLPGEDLQPEGAQALGGRASVPHHHTNVMQAMEFRGDCAGHSSTQAATRAGPQLRLFTGTGMASRLNCRLTILLRWIRNIISDTCRGTYR